jgi:hypothetical protein
MKQRGLTQTKTAEGITRAANSNSTRNISNQRLGHPILRLQRTIGNRAVQRLIKSQTASMEAAHGCSDGVSSGLPVGDVVSGGLSSPGQPLDGGIRSFMEARFGFDFGSVRIHTDPLAAVSSEGINAKAYTIGQDVVFGPGKYSPGSSEGKKLIAHELAHVVQQFGATSVGGQLEISNPWDQSERAADEIAEQVVDSNDGSNSGTADAYLTSENPAAEAAPMPRVSRQSEDDNQESSGGGGLLDVLSSFAGPALEVTGDVADALGVPGVGTLTSAIGTTRDAPEAAQGDLGAIAKTAIGLLNTTASVGEFGLAEAGGTALSALPEAAAAGELGTLGMAGPVGAVAGAGLAGWETGKGLDKLSNYVGQQITGDKKGDYSISGGIASGLMNTLGPQPGLWLADHLPSWMQ